MMTIDAHQHVWSLGVSPYAWLTPHAGILYRDHEQEEFRRVADRAGVSASILVQADDDARDTAHMLAVAEADPSVVGVVAFVALHDAEGRETTLDGLARDPLVVGIRNLTHDRPDGAWMSRRDFLDGAERVASAGLVLDLVGTTSEHFRAALDVIKAHPGARIVLDHLMKPPLGSDLSSWKRSVELAAAAPNVSAKLSGLTAGGSDPGLWTIDDLREAVDFAWQAFGPERLMFGGDWPVVELAGGYSRALEGLRSVLAEYPEPETARVWSGTAIEVYRLDPSRLASVPA
jgi:L-fuconolactonase